MAHLSARHAAIRGDLPMVDFEWKRDMCGIAGWQLDPASQRDPAQLVTMARSIAHRGPDDDGVYVDPKSGIGLAHRRLSIIDLSAGGHQPMASADGSVVLIFNGELYNYVTLRRELEAL